MKKILLVPDVHAPYHDTAAWRLLLKVGKALQPDIVVQLGDLIDNYAVSSHLKTHGRKLDWQHEIDEARTCIQELEALAPRRMFVEGNHEDRWPRYLATMTTVDNRRGNSVPDILGLGKRWEYVPYRSYGRIGKLHLTHDTGKAGKYAVHQSLDDFQANVVIGHLHRIATVYSGDARGTPHVAACLGWLGNVDEIDYMHRVKAARDWRLGFGVGYLEASGVVHLQTVPIIAGCCVVEGVHYTGSRAAA